LISMMAPVICRLREGARLERSMQSWRREK
jgi:hypothetical protein